MKRTCGVECSDVVEVRLIHGHDEVEGFQILRGDWSGTTADGEPMALQSLGHSGIGRGAGVEADRACGIDQELLRSAALGDLMQGRVHALAIQAAAPGETLPER